MKYAIPMHRRDIIRNARQTWNEQYRRYPDEKVVGWSKTRTAESIRTALENLDLETCSSTDIDAAIATTGWADNKCDTCGKNCAVVLRLGEEPDYEARWWDICADCLMEAGEFLASTFAKV